MSTLVETPGLSLTSTADTNDYGAEAPNDARDDKLNLDSNEKTGDEDLSKLRLDELKLEDNNSNDNDAEFGQQADSAQPEQEQEAAQPKQLISSNKTSDNNNNNISIEEFIRNQLQQHAKDRLFMLNIENEMIRFIKNEKMESYRFSSMNTYYRMLVHKVGDYFDLGHNVDHNKMCVIVFKTDKTKIPSVNFESIISSFKANNPDQASSPMSTDGQSSSSSSSSSSGNTAAANSNETGAQQKQNKNKNSSSNGQPTQKKQILKREVSDQDAKNQKNKLNTKDGNEVRTKTFEEKEADYIKAKNRIFNNNPKTNESSAPDMSNETSAPDTNTHPPSSSSTSSHQYTILNRQNSNKTPNLKPHHHAQPPAQNTSNQFNKTNKNKNPNYPNNNANKQSNYANGAATKRVSPNLAQTSTSNMPLVAQQAQQTAHYTPNQVVYTQPYSLVQHHPANVQLNSPMSSQTGYQQVLATAQGQFHQENLISSSQTPPTPQSQQAAPHPGYFILAHPSYQNQNVPQPMQLANPAGFNPNQGKQAQQQTYYTNYLNEVQQQQQQQQPKNSPVQQQTQISLDPKTVYMQSNPNYGYIQQPAPTSSSHYVQSQPQMAPQANTGNVRPNFGYMTTQPMPPNVNYPYQIVNPQANMSVPIMSQPQQAQYQTQIPLVPLAQQSPHPPAVLTHNPGLNGVYSDNTNNKLGSTYMNNSYPNNGMRKTKEEASNKPNKQISKSYSTRESNNYIKKETISNMNNTNAQKIQRSSSNNQANGSKYNSNSSNTANPSLTVSIQLQQIGVTQAPLMQNQSLKLHQSASFNANMAQNMPQPMSLNNPPLMYSNMYGMRPGAQAQAQAHPVQLNQMPLQQQLNQPPPFNPNSNKPYLQSYQIPKQYNSNSQGYNGKNKRNSNQQRPHQHEQYQNQAGQAANEKLAT